MTPRKRNSSLTRRLHRSIGAGAAFFVLFMVLSGIAINHSNDFGLDQQPVEQSVLLDWYGLEKPDSGEVEIGQTVNLAYVDQSRDALSADKTVFDEVAEGRDILTVGRYEIPSRAYLGRFNFKGGDQQKRVGSLSGGERGRLHMAKTLIAGGNVLLLDEPSNDLDVETLRALEDALLEFAGCVMVISHDRWFLDRIATHILAFEGDSQVVFFAGNYQEYEADKKKRLGEEAAKPKRLRFKPLKV